MKLPVVKLNRGLHSLVKQNLKTLDNENLRLEILEHKGGSFPNWDDDNVSIFSFQELFIYCVDCCGMTVNTLSAFQHI